MKDLSIKSMIRSTAVIAICFLLTSTGWLSWEYHLLEQIPAVLSDVCTMVIGYLLQAAGIGIYALFIYRRPGTVKWAALSALILHTIFMVPAVLSHFPVGTIVFGFLMNLMCGVIAGYYLHDLTANVPENHKAMAFGLGYAVSILLSWLLSLIGGGSLYYSEKVLIICLVLTAAAAAIIITRTRASEAARNGHQQEVTQDGSGSPQKGTASTRIESSPLKSGLIHTRGSGLRSAGGKKSRLSFILLAFLLVLLFSIVNNSGFAFPSADIGSPVNVELSRLVYAAGLIIAGLVTDKSRKTGAICALAALMIPFIILALRGETVSAVIFWALSYFIFGFYAVFRII